jgi:hypothetical protein
MCKPYNPLDKENLGQSVRDALLKQSIHQMPISEKLAGAGIYAIYYVGNFKPYRRIADQNRDDRFNAPMYVGKAVPPGARKGGSIRSDKPVLSLYNRLKEHSESIEAAQNLHIHDFFCRCLVVDDIWIPLGETFLIDRFQPLWNKVVEGFGIHTPGKRRKGQYTSAWDTVHPGRPFVTKLELPPNPKTQRELLSEIEKYLSLPHEQKMQWRASEARSDDGELG